MLASVDADVHALLNSATSFVSSLGEDWVLRLDWDSHSVTVQRGLALLLRQDRSNHKLLLRQGTQLLLFHYHYHYSLLSDAVAVAANLAERLNVVSSMEVEDVSHSSSRMHQQMVVPEH